jgi:murein DD-endopeptidase MepM/ murein hydrolase activator NlpD
MQKQSFLLLGIVCSCLYTVAQPQFELSRNIYRVPYANGTEIKVTNDHFTHDPLGRYDIIGQNGGASCTVMGYKIVAAAAGIIRRLVDFHDEHGPDCESNCENYNNYIWIEHANGEWSKYTHIMQYSASDLAGLQEGDTVCAGTFLGYECEIGQATGPHLHFEVRHPNDPNNIDISVAGGFMNDAQHRIPVINSISKHYFQEDDTWTASGSAFCPSSVEVPEVSVASKEIKILMASSTLSTASHSITYENGSNGLFQAGESIVIKPGFTVKAGSYFEASLRSCDTTPFPGSCR